LNVAAAAAAPKGEAFALKPLRIGLWDSYGGSMASGWIRWLLEQFEFPYELVFAPALDAGGLESRFDALILVGGSVPRVPAAGQEGPSGGFRDIQMPAPANIPEEYKNRIGRISAEKTVPILRQFVEAGGTILALDSATVLAEHFKLPLVSALVERAQDGKETPLRSEKFYVPGSILRARVDPSHPLAHGLAETVDVFYDNTPAFTLLPDAELKGVSPVVWFDDGRLLRSGWAWGEGYLRRSVQVADDYGISGGGRGEP
jgi:hypothetical protein